MTFTEQETIHLQDWYRAQYGTAGWENKLENFLHAHDSRLIDYLLEKWEEKEKDGESGDISNDIWYRDGFNSALTATRKLLEDCKKEL